VKRRCKAASWTLEKHATAAGRMSVRGGRVAEASGLVGGVVVVHLCALDRI